VRIYYSGGFPYYTPQEIDALDQFGIKRRLYSYHFIKTDKSIHDGFNHTVSTYGTNHQIMVDSGAFTISKKGATINIDEYAEFLLKNKEYITVAVNLDIIADRSKPLEEEMKRAAAQGWENLKYLESKGLPVIHVYHSGEDEKWLKMLMDNYEYFGVSKTGDVKGVSTRLERIFSKLVDDKGRCKWKIHGFAVTSPSMMKRYPFYSVDSASWIKYGCYGMVIMFYNGKFMVIGMSDRKLTLWRKKGQHYNNLNQEERKIWDTEMEKRGVTRDTLQDNRTRDIWNIRSFKEFEEWITAHGTTFKLYRKPLFDCII